jgi:hypothetical protein
MLLPIRCALIIGLTVLALMNYNQLNLSSPAEQILKKILPAAITQFIPAGIMGLLFTGLLRFHEYFLRNAQRCPGYVVNDIYIKYKS